MFDENKARLLYEIICRIDLGEKNANYANQESIDFEETNIRQTKSFKN